MIDALIKFVALCSPLKWISLSTIPIIPVVYFTIQSSQWFVLLALLFYHAMLIVFVLSMHYILQKSREAAIHLSEGDLRVRVQTSSTLNGPLFTAINRIGKDVSRTVNALSKSALELLKVADTVQADSGNSKSGALQQQDDVEQAKVIIDNLFSISSAVSERCEQTASLAGEAKQQAGKGVAGMLSLEDSLDNVSQKFESSDQDFAALKQESQKIGQVLETISSIAQQTNLLALNAAIESARAGEHGRGFAVVSDEVRELAKRTQEATEDIERKIENLQAQIEKVVQAMQQNRESISGSKVAASEAESSFDLLASQINQIDGLGQQIAESSEQQLSQTKALEGSLAEIEKVSASNVQATQDTLLASIMLRTLAGEIDSLLHRFATDAQQIKQEDSGRQKLIVWNSDLDIGLSEINRQHQTLVHLINELYYLLSNDYGLASIQRVIQGLIDYTANHFKYEETLFSLLTYEAEAEHLQAHHKLVKQIKDFQGRVNKGEAVGDELMHFLKAWLSQHIQQEDKAYVGCFKANGFS